MSTENAAPSASAGASDGGASSAPGTSTAAGTTGTSAAGAQADQRDTGAESHLDLDALLDAHLPRPPDGQSAHRGLDPRKVFESLPEDGRKLVANLRNDYRAKTEAIAKERQALQSRESAWLAQQESALRERMEIPDGIDPFTADGLAKIVEAQVAKAMLEAQRPLREQAAVTARRQELADFRSAHPDLPQYQTRIVELVGQGMKPEDAYWRAKGEGADALASKAAQDAAARATADRAAAAKAANGVRSTGLGSAMGPGTLQTGARPKTAVEALKMIQAAQGTR